jgi:LemA protein
MKRSSIVLLAIAGFAVLLLGTCAVQYNSLVSSSETVDESWAQVQNQLQRRADLIPNLIETVRGYAAHEKEIFTEVANARSRLLAANTPAEAEAADGSLNSALGRLLWCLMATLLYSAAALITASVAFARRDFE